MRVPELELELEFEFNAIAELELELLNSTAPLVYMVLGAKRGHIREVCSRLFVGRIYVCVQWHRD